MEYNSNDSDVFSIDEILKEVKGNLLYLWFEGSWVFCWSDIDEEILLFEVC